MARLPRFFVPDTPQHVIQRGNDRQPIFRTTADLAFFKDCLAFAARRHGVSIHAYVLMTNHVHLLATPEVATSLPRAMQSLGRVYVQYFNSMQGRSGTLWEGRYKAAIVDSDRYLLACMRYIELNPVRAGLVEHPERYPWSSHRANAFGVSDPSGQRTLALPGARDHISDPPSWLSRPVWPTGCRRRNARDPRRYAERVGTGHHRVSPRRRTLEPTRGACIVGPAREVAARDRESRV
jgi:REP element-mobilizing transposase RayT